VAKIVPALPKSKRPSWGALSGKVFRIADDFDDAMGDQGWNVAQ